jgi:endonuclease/exonuclease/phosphatase (EEP) superfamily protein YafD
MIAIYILSVLILAGILAPETDNDYWLIRGQDYFKTFYAFFAVLFSVLIFVFSDLSIPDYGLMALLICGAIYCFIVFMPFTIFWTKSVAKSISQAEDERNLKIFIFNVYQYNERYADAINAIIEHEPDVVLLLETCSKWEKAMSVLENTYQYQLKAIQEDTYGLMMMSKLPFEESQINYFVSKNIPSAEVLLNIHGNPLRIFGLHPKPPVPGEAEYATNKDKELIRTARKIVKNYADQNCLLIGDLNDVAWSKSSRIFKKLTNMKDPRVGRGFFSTFPASSPFKIPIDQVFCSSNLKLVEMNLLKNIGSDHLPLVVTFEI